MPQLSWKKDASKSSIIISLHNIMQGTLQILLILSIIIVALFLVITMYAYMPANIADSAKKGFFTFSGYLGTKLKELWTQIREHKTIAILSIVTLIYFTVSMYFIYKKPKTFGKYSQVSNIVIMVALFGIYYLNL